MSETRSLLLWKSEGITAVGIETSNYAQIIDFSKTPSFEGTNGATYFSLDKWNWFC
jgi:hypothetical protein